MTVGTVSTTSQTFGNAAGVARVSPSAAIGVRTLPDGRALLTLLKPVTWFPPMWAFACGVASAGDRRAAWPAIALGVCVAGPLVCGASQAVNDWYDRHVDAVNEPGRPIPSGRVPGRWGLAVAVAWSALALCAGAALGTAGAAATAGALALAWAYSAPPVRLKENGWWGNLACGVCYESLAWITGAAVALGGLAPAPRVVMLAGLYGLGAHGIMTLNDFKSVDGDRRFGVRSLPVRLGEQRAAHVAAAVMLLPQLIVIGLLAAWTAPVAAAVVAGLVVVQLVLMRRLLSGVTARSALLYSAFGVPFYVAGMMAAAWGVRA